LDVFGSHKGLASVKMVAPAFAGPLAPSQLAGNSARALPWGATPKYAGRALRPATLGLKAVISEPPTKTEEEAPATVRAPGSNALGSGLARRSQVTNPIDKAFKAAIRVLLVVTMGLLVSSNLGMNLAKIPERGLLGELVGLKPRIELAAPEPEREMGAFYMWRNVEGRGALPDKPFMVLSDETADALVAARTVTLAVMGVAALVTAHALWQDG